VYGSSVCSDRIDQLTNTEDVRGRSHQSTACVVMPGVEIDGPSTRLNSVASYVIVTPAFNEAQCIEKTIESVLSQTVLPVKWLIVDDGSTDGTAQIVERYARQHDWLDCRRRERVSGQSYFTSNVYAIMEGVESLRDVEAEFLAVLDADISLPTDYYQRIIEQFRCHPRLGVASTPKAIQVFRTKCFEEIGGYIPLPYGGEDTCACITARVKGWKTWSFPDIKVVHLRPTGMGNTRSILRTRFNQGLAEYDLGSHPLFALGKAVKRCLREKPYGIGGVLRLAGFTYGYLARKARHTPSEVQEFSRREQVDRLLHWNRIPPL
jgi:biofilm PGA synthesis N-glycosyltransferase PgaC